MSSAGISTVESGMDVEEQSFTWRIKNFNAIAKDESMINSQRIELNAGDKLNRPSKVSIWLQTNRKDRKLSVCMFYIIRETGAPPGAATAVGKSRLYSQMSFFINNDKGKLAIQGDGGIKDTSTILKGWGFIVFPFPVKLEELELPETLEFQTTFKLYAPSKPVYLQLQLTSSVQETLERFQAGFFSKAQRDLAGMFQKKKKSASGGELKIISSDGEEFAVSKGILAARSPVFEAMLRTDMKESNDGRLELPDISEKTLKVLLQFILTGELQPNWKQGGVILELTNAAAKYELSDLLQFLDEVLGKVCNLENVGPLLSLANQLSLKTAEEELLKFVKEKGASSTENFVRMMKSSEGGGVGESLS